MESKGHRSACEVPLFVLKGGETKNHVLCLMFHKDIWEGLAGSGETGSPGPPGDREDLQDRDLSGVNVLFTLSI